VAVRESERANPGVPVVLRVNRKLTIGSDRKFPPGLVIGPGTAGPIGVRASEHLAERYRQGMRMRGSRGHD